MKSTVKYAIYIKFESATDIASDSPWMCCVGQDKGGKECNYWVHSVCKGFADASEEDIERLNFYCPEHNKRANDMRHSKQENAKLALELEGVEKDKQFL